MNRNKKVIGKMTVTSAVLVMTTITALGGSTEDSNRNDTAVVVAEAHDQEVPLGNVRAGSEHIQQKGTGSEKSGQAEASQEQRTVGAAGGTAELLGYAAGEVLRSAKEAGQEYIVAENQAADGDRQENASETAYQEAPAAGIQEVAAEVFASAVDIQDTADMPAEPRNGADALAETAEGQEAAIQTEITVGVEAAEEQAETAESQDAAEVLEGLSEGQETTGEQAGASDGQEAAEEQAETAEGQDAAWTNMVMANVEEDMNIRTEPNPDSELAGKFYRGDVAEVLSIEGEWTKISSGNATGYVKNEYLVYGEEANQLANEVCSLYATVNTDGLRLRSEPHEEAGVVTTASDGERLKVNKEAEGTDGWVAVYTADSTAYVSADYVNVELNLGTALNSEEVAEKEAQKAAEEQAANGTSKKAAASANSDEVTLLGALIQCEAGGGSYDGMVAVGAVVMNRVRSGSYPGSISGVIYQGGQFTPALNGGVARVLANGVNGSCLQAARDAIGGTDNTGGALSFRSASSGHAGRLIGANVFF